MLSIIPLTIILLASLRLATCIINERDEETQIGWMTTDI